MKLFTSLLAMLCVVQMGFSQTYSPDFLDGTILFKLKTDPVVHNESQKDKNDYSLKVDLQKYPEIAAVFDQMTVTELEKPSFFTRKSSLQNIFRIHFTNYDQIDQLVRQLSQLPNVEYAEKEPIYKIDFVPNDTYHTGNNKWYHTLVGSEAAWNISQGSTNVKVAIVDNAVFCGHQDLTTFAQYDVADNDGDATPPAVSTADFGWSHGTHCAGLATADINNGIGIASLGANVQLIGVKATPNSASSSGSVWYSYEGVQWACENGANVVSMSFGGSSASASFQTLINAYPNIVFLAAAGNDAVTTLMYPGAYNNVICVGSVNSNDSRSSFSNYNGTTPFVDIASPGGYSFGGLYSTVYTASGNGYDQMGGTSMATPFAAGLVGLMLSVNPTMSPTAILNCLTSTGVNINQAIGPRINALAALQCVQATVTGDPLPFFTGSPTSIIEGDAVTFTNLSADGGFPITNYTWSFPGGTPSTFVGANPPAITYATAGVYSVSLSATNSQSTQTYTQTNYINVTIPPYGEWLPQNSGFAAANRGIGHISIVDANTVWAVAYDGTGGGANVQEFTKTTDGGTTWTPGTINVNNTGLGIGMIHAFSSTKAWLAAYPNASGQTGGIWITTNGGTTWTRQNTATFNNSASFTNAVYFWDENEGVCVGDPINNEFEIYRTVNGGTTWTLVSGTNIPNPQVNEFGYTRQMEVVGNSVWFTTSKGRIYHSTNKGATWTVYTSPITDFGGGVVTTSSGNLSFSSLTNGIIVNQAGSVWKTTNSGSTWTPVTTTGTVYTSGLCYIEGTSTVFTTGAAAGAAGSSYSTDNGSTWNLIDTDQHLYVEFINPSIGWSGWFNTSATANGIWKWNDLSSSLSCDFDADVLNVCTNQSIVMSDSTSGAVPTSWSWQFPGGTPATSTLQNPTVSYAAAGVYDVILTVSDGVSQTSLTKPAYITVSAPTSTPSAITGSNAVCPNTTNTYSVTAVPNVIYNWTVPATWTGTSSTNTIILTTDATSGTISVTAENICGNSTASSLPITVFQGAPTASFNNTGASNSISFTSTSTDAASWNWSFGDGVGTSTLENPTYTYLANGTYTVTLIVSNDCGADTITQSVTITGLGLTEDTPSWIQVYPVPAVNEIFVNVTQELDNKAYVIYDLTGKAIRNGKLSETNTAISIEDLASGMYELRIADQYNFHIVKR
ncbi:MAG: S8 family serine peptidase [Fluviicola sp.]|nr:S8 family serine peptidase [Fluviicola sp.]